MLKELFELLLKLVCGALLIFLSCYLCTLAVVVPYRENAYTVTGTLVKSDCVKPYYRCYDRHKFLVDGESTPRYLYNEDDIFFLKFNSNELYNHLQVGHRYELIVTGPSSSNPVIYFTGIAMPNNIISATEIEN